MATIQKIEGKRGPRYAAIIRKKVDGRLLKLSRTFGTRAAAKSWAKQKEDEIEKFGLAEYEYITLREAVDKFIEERLPELAETGRRNYEHRLNWWCDKLGPNTKLSQIRPSAISKARDDLAPTVSRTTVNHYLVTLASLYKQIVKQWNWMPAALNPVVSVAKLPGIPGRKRFLGDTDASELPRLLKACKQSDSKYLYAMVLLSITTGARQGEVRWIRWEHVDMAKGLILLPKTKNGDERTLTIVPEVHAELKKIRNEAGAVRMNGLVFPGKLKDREQPIHVRQSFAVACRRGNIKDFRWHDLRHSTASYLVMNGATLAEVGEVLGHRSVVSSKRYPHLSQEHKNERVTSTMAKVFSGLSDGD